MAPLGIRALSIPGATHRDHDRVPGGGEDVRVVVALVVLGELLGEEFTGELEAEGGAGFSRPHRDAPSPINQPWRDLSRRVLREVPRRGSLLSLTCLYRCCLVTWNIPANFCE